MSAKVVSELAQRLREANADGLLKLIRGHLAELDVEDACQALHSPFITAEAIDLIVAKPELLASYELRREAAMTPQTPQILALRFISGLYWRDLVRVGLEVRLAPVVRRGGGHP